MHCTDFFYKLFKDTCSDFLYHIYKNTNIIHLISVLLQHTYEYITVMMPMRITVGGKPSTAQIDIVHNALCQWKWRDH